MQVKLTKQYLIDFEQEVETRFTNKEIRAPIHLSSNNEDQLIKIFENINEDDWVCNSWRSHYHCLLKGVPRQEVMDEIIKGNSILLNFPKYRVITSAIVGGIVPIALGIAMGIKRSGGTNKVHLFIGDMTAETGIFGEVYKYACGFKLPLKFIMEDNGKSVCTPTKEVWGYSMEDLKVSNSFSIYKYTNDYQHAGTKVRVQF